MPWLAVPFSVAEEAMSRLGGKYGMKGIPHLMLLSSDGVAREVRRNVLEDPKGLQFPWTSPLTRLVPDSIKSAVSKKATHMVTLMKQKVRKMIRGLLQGWVPKGLLDWML